MTPDKRKPPGRGGLSGSHVAADRPDISKDSISVPSKQTNQTDLGEFRFRRNVERLCNLGARAVAEFLVEIGEQRGCRTYLERRVERYGEIDPEHLSALGGDTFPRPPIYEVRS